MMSDTQQQKGTDSVFGADTSAANRGPRVGSTRMRVRARLINLIGEELISDEPVAVVELVKNSYDVDAKKVEVRFEGSDPTHPSRLVVQDDGIGMDISTVLDAWLEPGTIAKRRESHSPAGRLYQGAKGIGRFAAARLGDSLLLETRRRGQDDVVYVLLNWGSFDETRYLDEIDIDYEVQRGLSAPFGTKLTIEGRRMHEWNEENFERLHQRLSRLISPFSDISDFEVDLQIPAAPHLSGPVEPPQLVLKPRYLLTGRLNADGVFAGEIAIDGKTTAISHSLGRGEERPVCGPFQVEVRGWDRDREGLAPIASRENMAISQIRKTLERSNRALAPLVCASATQCRAFQAKSYSEDESDSLASEGVVSQRFPAGYVFRVCATLARCVPGG